MENPAETKQDAPHPPKPPRLLDQLRDATRRLHYAYSTEKSYVSRARSAVGWKCK
ncbi:MAG: hypothetical protein KatS3mg053_4033 [Candidatus Roseilinea sp.]|nr:MAG: hypothetical protein KatS3mg053_4033 [Candidatus Roseilinea sp.]